MEEYFKMSVEEAGKLFDNNGNAADYIRICQQQGLSGCIEYIQQITGCDADIAEELINQSEFLNPSQFQLSPAEITRNRQAAQDLLNKPKCPTCNSTNLKKIPITSKVVNTAVFGLFGTKRFKQFHCNNCGDEW